MTSTSNQQAKEQVFNICQEMQKTALVLGTSGNASLRIRDTDTVAISPSNLDYLCMCVDDVPIIDMEGETIEGDRNPSIERYLHLAIYKTRPDVNAIIHTHSLYASAIAVLKTPLPPIIDEFVRHLGGQIEVAEYGLPGSQQLANNVVEALGPRNGVLMVNHGALCCGTTMDEAFHNILLLERVAHIYLLAAAVDKKKISLLSPEAFEAQLATFEMNKRFKRRE